MHDVIVIGGGFAGVTTARETTLGGAETLLLEARDRLGGRTWTSRWNDQDIELGGGWVHWHQPHVWAEITRAGLRVEVSEDADVAGWFVGEERRSGTISERDAIAERGWNQFVDGVEEALPQPHDPLFGADQLARFDGQTIAERLDELDLNDEERDVLAAELESVAHGRLDEAGAVSILRWHALSGGSLALTQFTGGRVTLATGTRSLLEAIASGAAFETRLETPVAAVTQQDGGVEVHTRAGETLAAKLAVVALPLNALGGIEFDPPLSESEAGRRRPRAGVPRDQDLHPRSRRAGRSERHQAGPPLRLHRHRSPLPGRDAAPDRFRARRGDLRRDRPARGAAAAGRDPAGLRGARRAGARLAGRRVLTWDVGDPPSRLVHDVSRRDAEARGQGDPGRLGHRERLVRLHGRRDRVGPAGGRSGSQRAPLTQLNAARTSRRECAV